MFSAYLESFFCRENKKPYLLIDFAEYLRINVYVFNLL